MSAAQLPYIPCITSEAGMCLTADNWKEVGVSAVSCALYDLLLKPGVQGLKQIDNLKKYLAWDGILILNAHNLPESRKGYYILKSTYDGSKILFDTADLVGLINHLKPDALVLPPHFMSANPEIWTQILVQIVNDQSNDEPASLGYQGLVYALEDVIDLKQTSHSLEFMAIDSDCLCPTCKQGFTRAYLHHLYHNTPNLCQRYLIQHNAWTKAQNKNKDLGSAAHLPSS